MSFRPSVANLSLYTTLSRHFSSSSISKLPKLRNLSKISSRCKPKALQEARKILTDYLHATRSVPYAYADQISQNSTYFLSDIIVKVGFSPSKFSKSLQRFLRYHPINEFEFFYESIGIQLKEINGYLPANKFFLSEDSRVFSVACALASFGFPWNKLGKLYKDENSIFIRDPDELNKRLYGFKDLGFSNTTIIGICLVFTYVLSENEEVYCEINALIDDLKTIFIDFDLASCVEGNVDAWYELCRKIRVFYDLGCEKGKLGVLMGTSNHIFLKYSEEALVQKVDFFCRLGVEKEEVGLFLLSRAEIFYLDLESPIVSVMGFLKHFGMNSKDLESIAQAYPYVLGRNKITNLPQVMKLLKLNKWFFDEMKNGKHHLLSTYVIENSNEDVDKDYIENLDRIKSSCTPIHTVRKLDFLHSIGYGENKLTIKVLRHLHGTGSKLEERFDCLLHCGIEYSKLCKMISFSPKILNQKPEILQKKMRFFCEETGSSMEYLDKFPAYLCFDLEKRIKPRYKFFMWLLESGLCERQYALSSMIATSEKQFIAVVSRLHPDAPKKWCESFSNKNHSDSCGE